MARRSRISISLPSPPRKIRSSCCSISPDVTRRPVYDGPSITSGGSMQQREHLELTRVKAFSDGVIAIAATLLAINIHLTNEGEQSLDALLDQLAPQIGAFLISFAVCAVYWRNHNRMFNLLHRIDPRLNSLNMVQLASICLMPFASGLIAGDVPSVGAMTLYAAAIALVGVLSAAQWAYIA